jgi:hypothetical protein
MAKRDKTLDDVADLLRMARETADNLEKAQSSMLRGGLETIKIDYDTAYCRATIPMPIVGG